MRDLRDIMMMADFEDFASYWCVPNQYKDIRKFEEKLSRLEEKYEAATINPFQPSGHAFVVFDSIESAVACKEFFRPGVKEYCKYSCEMFYSTFCCCMSYTR